MQAEQTGTQVFGPVGSGAVFIGVPAADGGHLAGSAVAAARACLFPIHARTPGNFYCWFMLCARLVVHGYTSFL